MRYLIVGLCLIMATVSHGQIATRYINVQSGAQYDDHLEDLYKHFHANPELSFYEKETAKRLAEELRLAGCDEVTTDLGGHGVVGIMRNGEGKTIMVRADIDALPVVEETGLPYASTVTTTNEAGAEVGAMHACGHDVHMTSLVGTARLLGQTRNDWSGTVIFIGQPAEERAGGANAMLEDGLYEKFPLPDYVVALHTSASLPAGHIGYTSGYAMANVNMVNILVKGQGGHGAYPHTTKDPVVLAARIVLALQTIVAREISPLEPAVVTVGSIHGGTKGNIIGNEVKLELTLRSYADDVRAALIEKIARICKGEAIAAGLPEELWPVVDVLKEETPSLYNDPELTAKASEVFYNVFDDFRIHELPPVMGGEDFARYGRTEHDIPVFLFWLGAVPHANWEKFEAGEMELPSLHSSKFAPEPKPTVTTGVRAMTSLVNRLLAE